MIGYMYILQCCDGSYYTGSTKNLERRLQQHQEGKGANHTKKRLPVTLVYYELYDRIDTAFYREKQVQGGVEPKRKLYYVVSWKHYRDFLWRIVTRVLREHFNKLTLREPQGSDVRVEALEAQSIYDSTSISKRQTGVL